MRAIRMLAFGALLLGLAPGVRGQDIEISPEGDYILQFDEVNGERLDARSVRARRRSPPPPRWPGGYTTPPRPLAGRR